MHDLLLDHQGGLRVPDLLRYAEELGLDVDRFTDDLRMHTGAARIAEDVDSADLSGVSGTPSFFINGKRHYGAYDIDTLTAAVKAAKARTLIAAAPPRRRHTLAQTPSHFREEVVTLPRTVSDTGTCPLRPADRGGSRLCGDSCLTPGHVPAGTLPCGARQTLLPCDAWQLARDAGRSSCAGRSTSAFSR